MKFQLIIRGRNCTKYVKKCLDSVLAQTHKDWKATVCLDAPTDNSYEKAIKYTKDKRISVYRNKKRLGVAHNMVETIMLAAPDDTDILAIVDADDEIPKNALHMVNKEYEKNPLLRLTYGSFWRLDKKRRTKTSRRYKSNVSVRKQDWHGSHLKTFRYDLYKRIPHRYFKHDNNNKWFMAASDLALMFPLFDLLGVDRYKTHTKYVKEITYKWNRTSDKTRGHEQYRNKQLIKKKKPLKRLEHV
ncbi:MAG: glycosyltransferase family 2 protein [PVC group bacterium]|nr:glycosyltransferase family 2 protein [PVC group bacterium]